MYLRYSRRWSLGPPVPPRGSSIIFKGPQSFPLGEDEVIHLIDRREQRAGCGIYPGGDRDFLKLSSVIVRESCIVFFEWRRDRGG